MKPQEFRASAALAAVFSVRLLGLFMIYPVFAADAGTLAGANPYLIGEALGSAGHGAGERVAHTHGDGRRWQLTFLHDVEVRVERRDLIDFGERHFHLGGERGEMCSRQVPVLILNEVQMLDQEIAPAPPGGLGGVGRRARQKAVRSIRRRW